MGLMDKAKKLADQAQQKLDEVQDQFNQSQGSAPKPGEGTPAGEAPPPSAEPVDAGPEKRPADSDTNQNPDPFKPIQ
jgi:hypothetical protein